MSKNQRSKPRTATQGQSTKVRTSTAHNKSEGGVQGQSMSTRNKPIKPHVGTQGQPLAGGKGSGSSKAGKTVAQY
jgi:hypothetical protein